MIRKKILSFLIAAVMVLVMVPATAWASNANTKLIVGSTDIKITDSTIAVLTSQGFASYLIDKDNDNSVTLLDTDSSSNYKYITEYSSDSTFTGGTYTRYKDDDDASPFVLFFAMPKEEYALTTFKADLGEYVYSIDILTDEEINKDSNIYGILETDRNNIYTTLLNAGYIAVFGYSYNKNNETNDISSKLTEVTAVSEKLVDVTKTITEVNGETVSDPGNVEVYEGDVITYEITVTRINAITYNNENSNKNLSYGEIMLTDELGGISGIDISSNENWAEDIDGKESYCCTYIYTVDDEDVATDEINNTAIVNYEYSINLAGTSNSAYTGSISVKTTHTVDVLEPFTVSFNSNGGSSVSSQEVKEGGTVTEPDDPTRKGYTFVGWYNDDGEEFDFDTAIYGNTTLIAKWKKNKSSGGSSYSLDEVDTSDDDDDDDDEDYDSDIKLNTEEHFQYISGYPDGTVRPTANITRAEVATIFYRLLDDNTRNAYYSTYTTFDDVDSDQWYLKAIATLTNAGILHGDSDSNTFRPDDNITRAEFATIVSFFDEIVYTDEDAFNDISGHWANVYINSAYAKGWVAGYNGYFNPDTAITRAKAMTLINNVLGREVDEDGLHEDAKQWPDNLEFA